MTNSSWREAAAPLWRNNIALAQLLGLCPLLAVTTTVVNGIALGLATAAIVIVASTVLSLVRGLLVPSTRLLVSLLLMAALVTALDLLTTAVLYDLHEALGLFIPLIVVNSGLLAHANDVAQRRGVGFTFVSAVATGLGAHAERVSAPDEIAPAITRAAKITMEGRPVVLEFVTRADPEVPRYFTPTY